MSVELPAGRAGAATDMLKKSALLTVREGGRGTAPEPDVAGNEPENAADGEKGADIVAGLACFPSPV